MKIIILPLDSKLVKLDSPIHKLKIVTDENKLAVKLYSNSSLSWQFLDNLGGEKSGAHLSQGGKLGCGTFTRRSTAAR